MSEPTPPADIDVDKDIVALDPTVLPPETAADRSVTKAESAVALFLYGADYADIAKKLEYSSPLRARIAIERALAATANDPEDRDKMRKVLDKRLNRLFAAHMPRAVNPNDPQQLAYSARALAIIDRQAKLHGVDAPTQIQLTATDQYIEEFVQFHMPQARADQDAIEADILDAENEIEP